MNPVIRKQLSFAIGTALILSAACRASTPPQGPAITGVVKNESGRAIEDLTVQGCTSTVCLFTTSDANGRFSIVGLEPPVRVVVKTPYDDNVTPWRAEAIAPVHLLGNSNVDVGTVYVPTLPKAVPLGPANDPQTIALPDGLSLTLRRADLKMPLGVAQDDLLSAKLIAPRQVPKFADLGSEKVVAVYALYPFGTKSQSPIAVRLTSTLPAGTKVRLRTVHELDGTLSEPRNATSDGKYITSDPGTGIVDLTWLLVSR
jgi:hypothetical protein